MFNAVVVGIKHGDNRKPLALIAARVDMGSQTVLMLVGTQNDRVRYPQKLVDMIQIKHEMHTGDREHQERLDAVRVRVTREQQQAVVFPWAGGTYRVQLAPGGECPPLHVQKFCSTWYLWRPRHYLLIRLHSSMRLTTGFATGKLQKISLRHGVEGATSDFNADDNGGDAARMQYVLDKVPPLHRIGKVENHVANSDETLAWMHHVYERRRWYYIERLRDAEATNRPLSKRDTEQLEKTRDAVQPPRNLFDSDAQSRAHLQRLLEAVRRRPVKRTAAACEEDDTRPATSLTATQNAAVCALTPRTAAEKAAVWRAKLQQAGLSDKDRQIALGMVAWWERKDQQQAPRPLKRSNAVARAAPPSPSQQETVASPTPV